MVNTNDHISIYICPQKYIKGSMGKWYLYYTKYFATKIVSFYSATTLYMFDCFTTLLNVYFERTPVKCYFVTTLINVFSET